MGKRKSAATSDIAEGKLVKTEKSKKTSLESPLAEYQDILFTQRSHSNGAGLRDRVIEHCLKHAIARRESIKRNTERLKEATAGGAVADFEYA